MGAFKICMHLVIGPYPGSISIPSIQRHSFEIDRNDDKQATDDRRHGHWTWGRRHGHGIDFILHAGIQAVACLLSHLTLSVNCSPATTIHLSIYLSISILITEHPPYQAKKRQTFCCLHHLSVRFCHTHTASYVSSSSAYMATCVW